MWNMNTQINGQRKSKKQDWKVGNTVKVGFLSLVVEAHNADGSFNLTSKDGIKKYNFLPHQGLARLN